MLIVFLLHCFDQLSLHLIDAHKNNFYDEKLIIAFTVIFQSEDVFLEAQVQNVTSGHLCLEKVSLEPSPMFRMASHNPISGGDEKEAPVFGKINFLQPQDSRQYLFSLTPRNDLRANYKQLRGATNIG